MSFFYRYLRPLKYNFNRNNIETSPRGGICFRVETDDGYKIGAKIVTISYSICHDGDVFDRQVAKTVADERCEHGITFTLFTDSMHIDDIVASLLELDKSTEHNTGAKDFYKRKDLRQLAEKIVKIQHNHRVTNDLLHVSKDVIESLNLKKHYEELQHR